VTDLQGVYQGSLWMAGTKPQYYSHLCDWYRATCGNMAEITGASVGAGRTLSITLDLADALFDAGYVLHVGAAVADMRDGPSEGVVPLTSAGAAAMLLLSVSGIALVLRRIGGWRHVLRPLNGAFAGRIHVEVARVAVFGLLLSSLTALWMTASTFGFLPDAAGPPAFPKVSGQGDFTMVQMQAPHETRVSALRDLTFPYPGDLTDAFALRTDAGEGFVDQGTGSLPAWGPLSGWDQVSETIYMLHSGQGASLLGLIHGLKALGVPVMAASGPWMWGAARWVWPRMRGTVAAGQAETIVLVGSEGGSTWGFAATLQGALSTAGQKVHVAPMQAFAPARFGRAERIIVLAAAYGNGVAPVSAKGFLERLDDAMSRRISMAVLGFGDCSFPAFCACARAVADRAKARDWPQFLPMDCVDRQSPQDFARWDRALGAVLNLPLELNHQPVQPRRQDLLLLSRRNYGFEVQAPTAILRFALPKVALWRRLTGVGALRFVAGDLLGIVPDGSPVPRFYSVVSASGDGLGEMCEPKHPDGVCSGQLMELQPGQSVRAFVRRNPEFRPKKGQGTCVVDWGGHGDWSLGRVRAGQSVQAADAGRASMAPSRWTCRGSPRVMAWTVWPMWGGPMGSRRSCWPLMARCGRLGCNPMAAHGSWRLSALTMTAVRRNR
jgi:sulfite reductase (NADPH) flavoprotein alpha-component